MAVLEKVKALPWESNSNSESNPKVEEKSNSEEKKGSPSPQRKRKRIQGYKEDPFVFFKDENEDVWPAIK